MSGEKTTRIEFLPTTHPPKPTTYKKSVDFRPPFPYTVAIKEGAQNGKKEKENNPMQIEVKIDASCTEPRVLILTDRMTEEVSLLLKRLAAETPQVIAGFRDDEVTLLEQADLVRIYAADGKVFAATEQSEFRLRLRLYELEDRLDRKQFVRISNSEIINLKKVKGFDLSYAGTICVSLSGGTVTYVSRRYVAKIKEVLGI